jgi:MoaA/NifB/PqqE/SkfB family radical SAM enzyme
MREILQIEPAPSRLKSVQIEPTTYCNLKCAGCTRTWRDSRGLLTPRNMPLATFKTIMANLPPGDICWLNGYGEPTLNEALPEMVAVAKQTFDDVFVISNLLARDAEFFVRMERQGLDQLHVSVDSLHQQTAELVRFGTDVEKLKERLAAVREAVSIPIIINCVVSVKNMEDVANTLTELDRIGGFDVGFADFGAFGGGDDDYSGWFTTLDHKAAFNAMLKRVTPRMKNLTFRNEGFKQRRRKFKSDRCPRPFFDPGVTVDGFLVPCCVELHNPGHYRFTSIVNQTLAEAWRSPAISGWLRAYLEREPGICKECTLNPWRNEKPSIWERLGLARPEAKETAVTEL